jgi:hypothetical protein
MEAIGKSGEERLKSAAKMEVPGVRGVRTHPPVGQHGEAGQRRSLPQTGVIRGEPDEANSST